MSIDWNKPIAVQLGSIGHGSITSISPPNASGRRFVQWERDGRIYGGYFNEAGAMIRPAQPRIVNVEDKP